MQCCALLRWARAGGMSGSPKREAYCVSPLPRSWREHLVPPDPVSIYHAHANRLLARSEADQSKPEYCPDRMETPWRGTSRSSRCLSGLSGPASGAIGGRKVWPICRWKHGLKGSMREKCRSRRDPRAKGASQPIDHRPGRLMLWHEHGVVG